MSGPKKPTLAAIRAAAPLSSSLLRPHDPLSACTVCGRPAAALDVWIEHDEQDRPLRRAEARIFVGQDHEDCHQTLKRHPRLYAEVTGAPGWFPRICGPCVFRRGDRCAHPKLRTNGGPGLTVLLEGPPGTTILCGPGGCRTPLRRAVSCEGQAARTDPAPLDVHVPAKGGEFA